MIIAKFGGTSVATAPRIETLCNIIRAQRDKKPIVVVSAVSDVTNLLLSLPSLSSPQRKNVLKKIRDLHYDMIKKLLSNRSQKDTLSYIDTQLSVVTKLIRTKRPNKATLDKLASHGEIMSSFVIAEALNNRGITAKQVITTELIVTDDHFGSAEILLEQTETKTAKALKPMISKGVVPVATGFIGATKDGKTTTFGRGGSDYTAAIIGFCLKADEIQIWTDVDGIFTSDPRIVPEAKLIHTISYKEASEMAAFGAKVLHPRTLRPAIAGNIPVRVLNTFRSTNKGTLITQKPDATRPITAVAFKRKTTLVNMYATEMLLQKGFLAHVFDIFAKNNISIDLVGVSEVSVSVTLDNIDGLNNAVHELSKFTQVTITKDLGIVSIIGEGLVNSSKTIKEIFAIMDSKKILVRMVSLGATNINVSLVVAEESLEKAVRALHDGLLMKKRNG